MYKRVAQQGEQTIAVGPVNPDTYPDPNAEDNPLIYQRSTVSATGHSWEFPVAGQYHFSLHSTHPYVEAGIVYNQLSNIFESYTVGGTAVAPPIPSLDQRTGDGLLKPHGVAARRRAGVQAGKDPRDSGPAIYALRYSRFK
jgi:hypothetical protein